VMRFQDGKILIDAMSKKMKPDDKMYSMSMMKSLIGYLVGHAVCDGYIKNLKDPVSRYLPEVKGTIYERVPIDQMINMAAGDQPIWKGKYNIQEYSALVLVAKPDERKTILEVLKSKPNKKPKGTGSFRYSNLVTDLIGVVLDKTVPGGLEAYMHHKLASPAGNADPMMLLVDKNDWPISHAFLYATRDDYMRMSIQIMNDFQADNCIGDYLRGQTKNYVKTSNGSEGYAAFFWLEDVSSPTPRLLMKGHGGQRIIIDIKDGTITTMHAIRLNYDMKKLEKLLR
jgi:CubicO group peptidase (beta-lactamase class C family)